MARKKRSNKPGGKREKRSDRPRGRRSKGRKNDNSSSKRDENLVKVKLKGMANGGYAIGWQNKRTTFIPYAIPGETIRARIIEQKGAVDFAQGVELVEASADRVFPQCPHFGIGQCWGCQWQHMDYQAQLLLKQDVLTDQLYRLGNFDDPTLERAMQAVMPSPQQWLYSYNITFERNSDGKLGFFREDGRSIEAIETCHILHPDLQALYDIIDVDYPDMQRLSLWVGSSGETMLLISMTSEEAPQLLAELPTSVNVVLPDNEPMNLVGDTYISYQVGGRDFRVTAGGTFRANVPQIDNLIAEVLNMLSLEGHENVLDLYAGVGVFSAFLALRAELVTLVESYPPMVTDAEENLADFDNVDIIEGSVEAVLDSLIDAGEQYHAAVIDPPSSGLSQDALMSLVTLNIPTLVYISSDPASLAHDAQHLVKRGYELQRVQPIDFAPQTYYIDCVALLTKS